MATFQVERLLLRPSEAAEALSTSRSRIYAAIASGLSATVSVGAGLRIPRSEVERLAAEGLPNPTAAGAVR